MKNIAILGSTGSIGVQALDVARMHNFGVSSLTAHSNVKLLENQIREFRPKTAALFDEASAKELSLKVADTKTKVFSGIEGICHCAQGQDIDIVLNSIVGIAGLRPTLAAINAGKTIALANKETLVAGGHLVMELAKKNSVDILPVDSEHSAIFQCLQAKPPSSGLKRIILTASGGPFFNKSYDELKNVKLEDALKHPNWDMGAKITIDSATMFNKGLELIEAFWLFSVSPKNIDILIHRESIIHSLIEFEDNSVLAQLGLPDMRIPIQYALTYPERCPSPVKALDLSSIANLSFYKPDYKAFDSLNICKEAMELGGLYPAAINGANERANQLFRNGKISFLHLAEMVRESMEIVPKTKDFSIDDVESIDRAAREFIDSKMT